MISFELQGPAVVHVGSLSHRHGLLGHLDRTEPLLLLLVTPVLFPLWGNVCCEKGVCIIVHYETTGDPKREKLPMDFWTFNKLPISWK